MDLFNFWKKKDKFDNNTWIDDKDKDFKSKYRVFMSPLDWQKLLLYARNVEGEISGLGTVEKKGNQFQVKDVFIVKQTCSFASTKLDQDDLSKKLFEYVKGGGDPSKWSFWFHVHPHSPFWSGTDDDTHKLLSKGKKHFVSLVYTKANEYMLRLEIDGKEVSTNLPLELQVFGSVEEFEKFEKVIAKEVKEKVKEEKLDITYPARGVYTYGGDEPSTFWYKKNGKEVECMGKLCMTINGFDVYEVKDKKDPFKVINFTEAILVSQHETLEDAIDEASGKEPTYKDDKDLWERKVWFSRTERGELKEYMGDLQTTVNGYDIWGIGKIKPYKVVDNFKNLLISEHNTRKEAVKAAVLRKESVYEYATYD